MTDTADNLRIIATETGRLSASDRAAIASAAEELEMAILARLQSDVKVLELNAQRIALNDRLKETRRQIDALSALPRAAPSPLSPDLPWSMSTGPIKTVVNEKF
jgi:hypothetical protein